MLLPVLIINLNLITKKQCYLLGLQAVKCLIYELLIQVLEAGLLCTQVEILEFLNQEYTNIVKWERKKISLFRRIFVKLKDCICCPCRYCLGYFFANCPKVLEEARGTNDEWNERMTQTLKLCGHSAAHFATLLQVVSLEEKQSVFLLAMSWDKEHTNTLQFTLWQNPICYGFRKEIS